MLRDRVWRKFRVESISAVTNVPIVPGSDQAADAACQISGPFALGTPTPTHFQLLSLDPLRQVDAIDTHVGRPKTPEFLHRTEPLSDSSMILLGCEVLVCAHRGPRSCQRCRPLGTNAPIHRPLHPSLIDPPGAIKRPGRQFAELLELRRESLDPPHKRCVNRIYPRSRVMLIRRRQLAFPQVTSNAKRDNPPVEIAINEHRFD